MSAYGLARDFSARFSEPGYCPFTSALASKQPEPIETPEQAAERVAAEKCKRSKRYWQVQKEKRRLERLAANP